MDSNKMLKTVLPEGCKFRNLAKLGEKPDWEIVPKRKPRRMSYAEVLQVITKYAPEMQHCFENKFGRFPKGGEAAMIVNYLNDTADLYRAERENIVNDLVDAATEIIVRCG
ncbi:MAG TPA: hypothetical protein PLT63_01220 [Syntrophales bacterium]|jgi:hypothetical protein|nr:hypothetical protein [Syntrophales bacterium]HPL66187.1 hypothetical protein [Smithellaceae bacterium]